MKKDNLKNNKLKNSVECDNYVSIIKENIQKYISDNNISIRKFIDISGLSSSTINNLLYGDLSDCKLSTVISLAKTMGMSIDELTSAGTIETIVKQNMVAIRNLPQNSKYLIRWFINHQVTLYKQDLTNNKKIISVMNPLHTNDGILKVANTFTQIDISKLSEDLKNKVFFGINLGCDWYMPNYSPYDILLIANDRAPFSKEHVLILIGENIFLAKQKYENGHYNYYGIRDDRFRCDESGVSEVIGYITGIISNTNTEEGTR